jgi:hypothetical protein
MHHLIKRAHSNDLSNFLMAQKWNIKKCKYRGCGRYCSSKYESWDLSLPSGVKAMHFFPDDLSTNTSYVTNFPSPRRKKGLLD